MTHCENAVPFRPKKEKPVSSVTESRKQGLKRWKNCVKSYDKHENQQA
jgi:hypothetical protein